MRVTVVEFARQLALAHESFSNQLRQASQQLADDRYTNVIKNPATQTVVATSRCWCLIQCLSDFLICLLAPYVKTTHRTFMKMLLDDNKQELIKLWASSVSESGSKNF